ncbi:MAG: hypothetical protein WBP41_12350 [Saprospiraceae bacterium]
MADFKRKFYLIAHNPNTIELARTFLRLGANALEPDTLEGIDLGHSIKSFTIEALTKGKNSGWLPSVIIISSDLLPAQLVFQYGPDDWLSFDQNPRIVREVDSTFIT